MGDGAALFSKHSMRKVARSVKNYVMNALQKVVGRERPLRRHDPLRTLTLIPLRYPPLLSPPMGTPFIITNNRPIIGWVFAVLWFGMLLIFTTLYFREGGFGQFPPAIEAGIVLMFWLIGAAGLGSMLLTPRTHLTVKQRHAILRRAWIIRRTEQRLPGEALAAAIIVHDKQGDDDPLFRLSIGLDGELLSLKESGDLAELESLRQRILATL
jgi:hypothetical protein